MTKETNASKKKYQANLTLALKKSLLVGALFFLLFMLTYVGIFTNTTSQIDTAGFKYINGLILPNFLSSLLVYSALYGREYFWVPLMVVLFLLGDDLTKEKIIELAILFAIGAVLGTVVKDIVFRQRPFLSVADTITRVPADYDSSFPSGHALIVSIGSSYSILSFKRNKLISLLLTVEAALVCFSRVYVGVHYPLDVLAGIFLGASVALAGTELVETFASTAIIAVSKFFKILLGEGFIKV